jgi:hypothetical protein
MPGKMYTDFLESAPIRKPCPNGPEGATRLYVEVTCPQCNKVFVDIPSESLRTCKASRCKRHLDRVHANHANHSNPPQAAAPNAPPAAATPILNACCERARRPLEDRIDALREEGRRASEEAEQRHRELLDELRAANRTRDAIAATVASPFKIAPPDAVTVGLKLPEKIHFHLKRMEDLQAANALFGSQLEASQREVVKLKRRVAELQRATRPTSAVHDAVRAFCDTEAGRKRMRAVVHSDKLPPELHAPAKAIRDGLGL